MGAMHCGIPDNNRTEPIVITKEQWPLLAMHCGIPDNNRTEPIVKTKEQWPLLQHWAKPIMTSPLFHCCNKAIVRIIGGKMPAMVFVTTVGYGFCDKPIVRLLKEAIVSIKGGKMCQI